MLTIYENLIQKIENFIIELLKNLKETIFLLKTKMNIHNGNLRYFGDFKK